MAVWDQLPDETDAEYLRFLYYLNVGMGRTLQKAYDMYLAAQPQPTGTSRKKQSVSGTWLKDSTTHRWVERATAFDIANVRTQGLAVLMWHYEGVARYAQRTFEAMNADTIAPQSWGEVRDALAFINSLIGPDGFKTIAGEHGASEPAADIAEGTAEDSPPIE